MADPFEPDIDQPILRVSGRPKDSNDGEELTRRDLLNFEALARLLGKKLGEAGCLAEEYARSKVAQESNSAEKLAAEAAEITARKEEAEANADRTRQDSVATFIDNVERISNLPVEAQPLAISKLILENPDLLDQLEKIEAVAARLRMSHGMIISPKEPSKSISGD